MPKTAFITGTTGQDASYLAEQLIAKGYDVHGLVQRSATFDRQNIDHIGKLALHYGDLTDYASLARILQEVKPDEIYNLGAMSHVGISWEIPVYTAMVTGVGVLNLLEATRLTCPKAKFYQASTSEMFSGEEKKPQNEDTPLDPRSPYSAAKLFGHRMCQIYRRAYGMFICCGILFNHESIPKNSPLIVMSENGIDVLPIEDLFKSESHKYEGILDDYIGKFIWNGENWTKIISGSCYQDRKKEVKLIQTRESCYEATNEHRAFLEDNSEIKTSDWKIGDSVFNVNFPKINNNLNNDLNFVKFLGYVVGDGYISPNGFIRLTGTNKEELIEIYDLIKNIFNWSYRISNYGAGNYPNCSKIVWQLDINNDSNFGKWLRNNIYTEKSKEKKVPKFILNAKQEIKKSFFDGYYMADGRKKGNETYKYKGFTTNSETLCLGLILLLKEFSNQKVKVKCEYRDKKRFYYTQFNCGKETNKGKHLRKKQNEIISILNTETTDGWLYDIQTESETFATGANLFKIHNSERRGKNFVTRKITIGIADILKGKQDKIHLGNIDAERDWGYAPDYTEAMWLMLQQEKPDDYVIATGEMHSVKEFLEEAFSLVHRNWKDYVVIDSAYIRPSETEHLCGDASKARCILGWVPKTTFKELVKIMVQNDIKN